MTRSLAVLRPEPGNSATAARIEARGLTAIRLPLFEIRALDWAPPEPGDFDALFLTSANAVRLAGPGLGALAELPVHAVGEATAAAARAAGLNVVAIGAADGAALVDNAAATGVKDALLLSGRDRVLDAGGIIGRAIAVYASDPISIPDIAILAGNIALLHSVRAAQRLADLAGPARADIGLAALSPAVAAAAGPGWGRLAIAALPTDDALLDVAQPLAD